MNQFDNYELTTLDYTLKYYLEHNEMLDDDDIEWCNIVRKKIDTIIELQAKYDMECGCLLYTSPSPRDRTRSRMPSSA